MSRVENSLYPRTPDGVVRKETHSAMFEVNTGMGMPGLVWIWLGGYILIPFLAYLKLLWLRRKGRI